LVYKIPRTNIRIKIYFFACAEFDRHSHKWLLLLLCLIWTSPAVHKTTAEEDGGNAIITRLNYGIILKHVDTLDVCTDTWLQTFLIRMPTTWNITISGVVVNCYRLQTGAECDRVIHLVEYLYNASNKAIEGLNHTLN